MAAKQLRLHPQCRVRLPPPSLFNGEGVILHNPKPDQRAEIGSTLSKQWNVRCLTEICHRRGSCHAWDNISPEAFREQRRIIVIRRGNHSTSPGSSTSAKQSRSWARSLPDSHSSKSIPRTSHDTWFPTMEGYGLASTHLLGIGNER